MVVGVRTQMYSSNQRSEVEASNIDDDGVTAGWYGMVPYSSVAALISVLWGFQVLLSCALFVIVLCFQV